MLESSDTHPSRASPWTDRAFPVGSALVLFAVLISLLTNALFLVGISVTPLVFWLALVAVGLVIWFATAGGRSWRILGVGAFLSLIAGGILIAWATPDGSFDGNSYHKVAVGDFARGWNPHRQSFEEFTAGGTGSVRAGGGDGIWVGHYPKSAWLVAATIYRVAGTIDSGKVLPVLMSAAAMLVVLAIVSHWLDAKGAVVVAVLAGVTPVAVSQVFSYYVDGVLGNLVVILVALLSVLIDDDHPVRDTKMFWATLAATMVLLVDLKFTGLFFAGFYSVGYLLVLAVRPRVNRWLIAKFVAVGTVAALTGVLFLGSTSYVQNLVREGNPLYPLAGAGSVDIITPNTPVGFGGQPKIVQFARSNLAASTNVLHSDGTFVARLKPPFQVDRREFSSFRATDTRVGGNGVLFSGLLGISVLVALWAFWSGSRRRTPMVQLVLPVLLTIVAAGTLEASWWARYLPQFGALPVLAVIVLMARRPRLGFAFAALVAANVAILAAITVDAEVTTRRTAVVLGAHMTQVGGAVPHVHAVNSAGALSNACDADPSIRVLTSDEFARLPRTSFVPVAYPGFSPLEVLNRADRASLDQLSLRLNTRTARSTFDC